MLQKLKKISIDKKRLFSNFLSLSALQGVNYLLPLITLPYLVRILGPKNFGLIAFAQAFIGYFVILTDYGFNLSATRQISINRKNKEKISQIFCLVMTLKFLLAILSFLILLSVLTFIPKFNKHSLLYLLTFGMVLGKIMFPVWLFQGMERMKYTAFLNILAKTIFTACIFIFIKQKSDYIYVPLLISLGFITAGIFGLCFAVKIFDLTLAIPKTKNMKYQLSQGWHIFISTMAVSLYTTSNAFILGLLTNNQIVGYYCAAEKLVRAVAGLVTPLSQAVYPYISKRAAESKIKAVNFIIKLTKFVGSGTLAISILIFIFAQPIINITLGSQYQQSIIILRILSLLPLMTALSNIFTVHGLYAFKYQRVVPRYVIPIALFHLIFLVGLTYFFSAKGTAFAAVTTETLITTFSIRYFSKLILKKTENRSR